MGVPTDWRGGVFEEVDDDGALLFLLVLLVLRFGLQRFGLHTESVTVSVCVRVSVCVCERESV